MGIKSVNSREAPYLVFINTWKHIRESGLDAAMGISALVMLYLIRWVFTTWAHKVPKHQRLLFFLNTLRSVFVILLYTLISWLVNMHRKDHPAFKILGSVPRGFQAVGVPVIDTTLIGAFARFLPASVIVLLVEHIAISKSFGRLNNYVIDPSQEMVAIGSKAGVRTPASGVITGAVVLLATYTLTSLFFYIPSASLAAVIIHAVADLVTSPNTVYQFWKVSPLEVLIFFIGVFVSVFSNIENGIYATVCISAAILFFRTLKARGSFLGKVRVHSVLGDHIIGEDHRKVVGSYGTFGSSDHAVRSVFLPITHDDGHNPQIDIQNPYPGIFIYRFTEGYERLGDRPWNDPGPSRTKRKAQRNGGDTFDEEDGMPTLKAIILDFSSVNHVDITSVQRLIDVRNQLDRYTAPETVDWHFACISNRWTKRALVSAGFGCWRGGTEGREHQWRSIFSVAEIGVIKEANGEDDEGGEVEAEGASVVTPIATPGQGVKRRRHSKTKRKGAIIQGLNRPLFHVDLTNALQSAIANVEARHDIEHSVGVTTSTGS
ncbi:unnamed protein product [Parascedosporium putredinis]|uniref:STAS domain-containing protein n=1 Tax=Parascedosporium putredinis TaxID=1442378 RepID=A0A9P1H0J9_9PEZI|nr:unnamed protein product [Parascedosporium putredinis]CAI7992868.1 unnamed protein product [Parascedosporium putredinis]